MKLNLTYKLKGVGNSNLYFQVTKNEMMGSYCYVTPSGFCTTSNLNCYNHFIPSGLIDYPLTDSFEKKPERLKLL